MEEKIRNFINSHTFANLTEAERVKELMIEKGIKDLEFRVLFGGKLPATLLTFEDVKEYIEHLT